MGITIKALSERSEVKIPTIRYYERQGMLPEPVRTGTGQRRYESVDVARLRFVRFGRGLGMEISEIRALIEMVGEGNGEEIAVMAEALVERARRMQALCIRLRAVSVAIVDGEINEANVFDALIERRGAQVEDPREGTPLPAADGLHELEDRMEPAPGLSEGKRIGLPANEPAAEKSKTKLITKRNATEPPLSKPKRKRTRARS